MSGYHKGELVKKLYDVPPSRNELAFQQKAGADAAKTLCSPDLADHPSEADLKEIFCIVH